MCRSHAIFLMKITKYYVCLGFSQWYHWLVTFVPLVPIVLPFLPFAPICLPMVPLVIKLAQMLPTNGTIGEPRTHAMCVPIKMKMLLCYCTLENSPVQYQNFLCHCICSVLNTEAKIIATDTHHTSTADSTNSSSVS